MYQHPISPLVGHVLATGLFAIQGFFEFYNNVKTQKDFIASKAWREQLNLIETFDFIVVGGGSAGSVVSNRLSVNNRVLLLEIGGDPNPVTAFPAFVGLVGLPGCVEQYATEPQNGAALGMFEKRIHWSRGLGLGGSSSINAAMYHRGNPKDYDNWASITGDSAWGFRNVLKYFKKMEDYNGEYPNSKLHSTGGPIRVERDKLRLLEKYWMSAAREQGYRIKDSNLEQEGFGSTEFTIRNGVRSSTFSGYLKPILNRPNLKIYRYARVVKIHLDKTKHAYGVSYIRHGQRRFVRARKEVIISTGSIETPKLLMLSGIGPKLHLNATGIKTRVNLPVGENLQDHFNVLFGPFLLDGTTDFNSHLNPLTVFTEYFQHPKQGILASVLQSVTGFVSSTVRNESLWPDIEYMAAPVKLVPGIGNFISSLFNIKPNIMDGYLGEYILRLKNAAYVFVGLQRPKSVGSIMLASKDAFQPPLIQPNYLSHPDDIKVLVEGIQRLVTLVEKTKAFARLNARLIPYKLPPCQKLKHKSPKYYECFIRYLGATIHHPVGTCAMGSGLKDKRAVLDSKLRVLKTRSLRVIDASVMPVIVNANTNIPTIMIGEIGSDFIREYWQQQYAICLWFQFTFLYLDEHSACFYTQFT